MTNKSEGMARRTWIPASFWEPPKTAQQKADMKEYMDGVLGAWRDADQRIEELCEDD